MGLVFAVELASRSTPWEVMQQGLCTLPHLPVLPLRWLYYCRL